MWEESCIELHSLGMTGRHTALGERWLFNSFHTFLYSPSISGVAVNYQAPY